EQVQVMLKLGAVHELVGKWKEAGRVYQEALTLAQTSGALPAQAQCRTATGELLRKRGLYTEAQEWLERARQLFDQIGDEVGVAQVLHYCGTVSAQQGDYEKARSLYEN